MDNFRDRKMLLVIYPDNPSHCDVFDILRDKDIAFACCLHDKDTNADGDLLKPHWHLVLKFRNARWRDAVASELQVEPHLLLHCDSFDLSLRYLIHADDPEKAQYEFSSVFGPLSPNLAKLLVNDDEGSRVLEIVRYIDESESPLSYRKLLVMCCENGLYGEFRRLGSGAKWLLDEHNAFFTPSYQKHSSFDNSLDQARFEGYVQGHSDKRRKEV